jgi:hypothetical protein
MIRVWESEPADRQRPSWVLGVVIDKKGKIAITNNAGEWLGRDVAADQIDGLIDALRKARAMAPKVAEAYAFETQAAAMVEQARKDRLAAIQRGEQ